MTAKPNVDDETAWAAVKTSFPGAAGSVYLNTAGGGCMSRAAAAAGRRYYDEAEAEGDLPWERWLDRAAEVRRTVARLIGAEEASIALLPNASAGLDFAQRLFDDGRDVLVLDREFPSVTLPWLNRGRTVRALPLDEELGLRFDRIDPALVAGAGTIAVSHVGFRTGYSLDLAELSVFARSRGLRTVVDATQSAGTFPIDVAAAPVDALVFSAYKWCGAGYGVGVLYLSTEHRWPATLPGAGWRSAADPYSLEARSFTPRSSADALELGHPPFAAAFALGAALDVLTLIGIDAIAARILVLNRHLHDGLDRVGVPVRSTRDPQRQSAITVAAVPNAAEIMVAMRERGVVVGKRAEDELRIGVHVYTLKRDIDVFLDALGAVLRQEH